MSTELTKQDILELLVKQAKEFHQRLLESDKNIDKNLEGSPQRFLGPDKNVEKSRKEFEKSLKFNRAEFNKRFEELSGSWKKFVAEMVKPKTKDLFKDKGINIKEILQNVEGRIGVERYYEIDLLLIDHEIAVVVEIKGKLSKDDVNDHLERMGKIQKVQPDGINLRGTTLYGAVAGLAVESQVYRYAYQKGLFVLRQKEGLLEIMNDKNFFPEEWTVEY